MHTASQFTRFPIGLPLLFAVVTMVVGLMVFARPAAVAVPAPSAAQAVEARSKATGGLLGQTALHLSKLLGGESIGGFPPFRPPDDDERYRDKIKNRSFTPEEADHWVKEINNLLNQVINKNRGMTLSRILQRQGLTEPQIDQYIKALQRVHTIAEGMEGYGVNPATVKAFESALTALGVPFGVPL